MDIYTRITYIYKLSGKRSFDFIDKWVGNDIYMGWVNFYNKLRPK